MQTCAKCGSTEFNENGKCAPCRRAINARYKAKNKDKIKQYNQDNKEAIAAYMADYHAKNKAALYEKQKAKDQERRRIKNEELAKYKEEHKEEIAAEMAARSKGATKQTKEQNRAYYIRNAEKLKKRSAEYRKNHPEKAKETMRKWREKNKDKMADQMAKYAAENKEKISEYLAQYKRSNPEKIRIHSVNRRAMKAKNGGKLSIGLTDKLFAKQKGKCPCCGLDLGSDYHLDHIMPLALGGSNSDDNMQLLRAECNMKKNAKHPIDYMQSKGFLL